MADRELQTVLNSGEITGIKIGGTTSADEVATKGDITLSISAIGTITPKTTQVLTPDTDVKLDWAEITQLNIGSDVVGSPANDSFSIATSAYYRFGGVITFHAPINDVIEFTLYVNGVATPFKNSLIARGNDLTCTVTYYAIESFNQGDTIEIYVKSDGTEITLDNSSVSLEKIQ